MNVFLMVAVATFQITLTNVKKEIGNFFLSGGGGVEGSGGGGLLSLIICYTKESKV